MSEDTTKPRRYSRRKLRGRVTASWSTRVAYPKLHVVADCESLDNTPEEARDSASFASAPHLATVEWGRPCRMCSLESVLATCLATPVTAEDPAVFVSFTSQANPKSPDTAGGVWSYDWHAATQSGQDRLARLTRRANLKTVHAVCGLVAYGFVARSTADALTHNLRTLVREDVSEEPSADTVSCLWTLLGDSPPELDLDGGDHVDPWLTAQRLTR